MNKSPVSLLSRVFGSVFGKINWSPPPWPKWVAGNVRKHPKGIGITLIVLAVAGWGGWKFWEWRESERLKKLAWEEAHRARANATGPVIRDVTVAVTAPGNPISFAPNTFQPSPAVLEFNSVFGPHGGSAAV